MFICKRLHYNFTSKNDFSNDSFMNIYPPSGLGSWKNSYREHKKSPHKLKIYHEKG